MTDFMQNPHPCECVVKQVTSEHLDQFAEVWRKMTTRCNLPLINIHHFLNKLPPPLGFKKKVTRKSALALLESLHVVCIGCDVHYVDMCMAICERIFAKHYGYAENHHAILSFTNRILMVSSLLQSVEHQPNPHRFRCAEVHSW